jgi:hypothetical protein
LATWLLIGIVAVSDVDVIGIQGHGHGHGAGHGHGHGTGGSVMGQVIEEEDIGIQGGVLDLGLFAKAVLLLGSVGWVVESFITGVITGFIYKIRPDIISSLPARKENLVVSQD